MFPVPRTRPTDTMSARITAVISDLRVPMSGRARVECIVYFDDTSPYRVVDHAGSKVLALFFFEAVAFERGVLCVVMFSWWRWPSCRP